MEQLGIICTSILHAAYSAWGMHVILFCMPFDPNPYDKKSCSEHRSDPLSAFWEGSQGRSQNATY